MIPDKDKYVSMDAVKGILHQAKSLDRAWDVIYLPYVEMPKWIPVTERLPEEDGCYIVSIDPFYCLPVCICIDLLHFIDGKWQYEYEGKMEEWKDPVLAWMPLPEPYKGGDAE